MWSIRRTLLSVADRVVCAFLFYLLRGSSRTTVSASPFLRNFETPSYVRTHRRADTGIGNMDIMTTPLPSNPDTRDAFRFFDLSRELRDMVYDSLLVDTQEINDPMLDAGARYMHLYIRNGPRRALLLVSHRFQSEYLERMRELATLQLCNHCDCYDCECDSQPRAATSISPALARLPLAEVRLLVGGRHWNLDSITRWLAKPLLSEKYSSCIVKVFLDFDREEDFEDWWREDYPSEGRIPLERVAALEGVSRVELFCNMDDSCQHTQSNDPGLFVASWTGAGIEILGSYIERPGWYVDVKD